MPQLSINGQSYFTDSPPDSPLLWVIREDLRLTGTKYGCGGGYCGACTVHINGQPVRSCQVKLGDLEPGAAIITIEGLHPSDSHPLQRAWIEHEVPQCGYCQSGQIMQAAALLAANQSPSKDQIVQHMSGNLCRCATYSRMVKAIERAAELTREGGQNV